MSIRLRPCLRAWVRIGAVRIVYVWRTLLNRGLLSLRHRLSLLLLNLLGLTASDMRILIPILLRNLLNRIDCRILCNSLLRLRLCLWLRLWLRLDLRLDLRWRLRLNAWLWSRACLR